MLVTTIPSSALGTLFYISGYSNVCFSEFVWYYQIIAHEHAREFLSIIDIVNERLLDQDSQYAFQGQHQPGKLSAVYCDQDKTFGVIRKSPQITHCLSCCAWSCCHVKTYRDLKHADYRHIPQKFPSITKHDIAYPLDWVLGLLS